jgi:prepilin-type N-terminal cleavage/methylation domain-containing protein
MFGRTEAGPPEPFAVWVVTAAILDYAEANEGVLPGSLADLDEEQIRLDDGLTLDMFVYVAPEGATTSFPPDTPIILFPWESGVHVGYLDPKVYTRFLPGGYSDEKPNLLRQRLRRCQNAFGLAVIGITGMLAVIFFMFRKGKFTLIELLAVVAILGVMASLFTDTGGGMIFEF